MSATQGRDGLTDNHSNYFLEKRYGHVRRPCHVMPWTFPADKTGYMRPAQPVGKKIREKCEF